MEFISVVQCFIADINKTKSNLYKIIEKPWLLRINNHVFEARIHKASKFPKWECSDRNRDKNGIPIQN